MAVKSIRKIDKRYILELGDCFLKKKAIIKNIYIENCVGIGAMYWY